MKANKKPQPSPHVGGVKTRNYEGAKAYTKDAETALYSRACCSLNEKSYYEGKDEGIEQLRVLVKTCDPEFTARLAVYCREEMHLRTMPVILAVELAKVHNGDDLVRRTVRRVVQRADEIPEMLAYYQTANESNWVTGKGGQVKKLRKLSVQLKKGLSDAFTSFDEYQLAKYNRDSEVKLKDALFLVHAKPEIKGPGNLLEKLVNDSLETPYTWEVELSNATKNGKTKTQVWEELIDSNKLGYMATLRNLRNILDADVSGKHIQKVCGYLSNEKAVLGGKQLPFRYLSAYRELQKTPKMKTGEVLSSLENAVKTSSRNCKGFDENTNILIACDVSGSMTHPISEKSSVERYDIGLLLGMTLQYYCKSVVTGIFGDTFELFSFPKTSILESTMSMRSLDGRVGYSTNGWKVVEYMIEKNIKADKVMIFTDAQMWDSTTPRFGYNKSENTFSSYWSKYKALYPKAELYLFDLNGYPTTPIQVGKDVYLIAGWSNNIFDVLEAIKDSRTALDKIREITL